MTPPDRDDRSCGPYAVVEKYLPPTAGERHCFLGFIVIDARGNEVVGPTRQRAARRVARSLNLAARSGRAEDRPPSAGPGMGHQSPESR